MSLSSTSAAANTHSTSTARALRHDLCNIMAARVGTYLTPRKNFTMGVIATYRNGDITHNRHQLTCGFSFKTMEFSILDKIGYFEYEPTLAPIAGCPDQFLLRLRYTDWRHAVIININTRMYEDAFPDVFMTGYHMAVTISFKDSDVFTGGDEYDTGIWTYKKSALDIKEAADAQAKEEAFALEFHRDCEENYWAYSNF